MQNEIEEEIFRTLQGAGFISIPDLCARDLEILNEQYKAKTVPPDTGGTLSSILLENGLADKISLLMSSVLVGNARAPIEQD